LKEKILSGEVIGNSGSREHHNRDISDEYRASGRFSLSRRHSIHEIRYDTRKLYLERKEHYSPHDVQPTLVELKEAPGNNPASEIRLELSGSDIRSSKRLLRTDRIYLQKWAASHESSTTLRVLDENFQADNFGESCYTCFRVCIRNNSYSFTPSTLSTGNSIRAKLYAYFDFVVTCLIPNAEVGKRNLAVCSYVEVSAQIESLRTISPYRHSLHVTRCGRQQSWSTSRPRLHTLGAL